MRRQRERLGVNRSGLYYQPSRESADRQASAVRHSSPDCQPSYRTATVTPGGLRHSPTIRVIGTESLGAMLLGTTAFTCSRPAV